MFVSAYNPGTKIGSSNNFAVDAMLRTTQLCIEIMVHRLASLVSWKRYYFRAGSICPLELPLLAGSIWSRQSFNVLLLFDIYFYCILAMVRSSLQPGNFWREEEGGGENYGKSQSSAYQGKHRFVRDFPTWGRFSPL